jgi:hypothetical protein
MITGNFRLSLIEIFFVEMIAWLAIWLLHEYVATLLTIIIGGIVSAVLIISAISEWIEPSKVPRKYFQVMGITLLTIVLSAGVYLLLHRG